MSKAFKVPVTVSTANATAATRYVGGTPSGSPSAGAWAVGDFVVDQTGKIWICTAAGTPGTWTTIGSGGRVASSQIVANVTVGTSEAEIAGLAATFIFTTGRRYKISVHGPLQQPASGMAAGIGQLIIRWAAGASVTTAGTMLQSCAFSFPATASYKQTLDFHVVITCVASGATGSQVNAGSNTVGVSASMPTAASTLVASATTPCQITVEDIGT